MLTHLRGDFRRLRRWFRRLPRRQARKHQRNLRKIDRKGGVAEVEYSILVIPPENHPETA